MVKLECIHLGSGEERPGLLLRRLRPQGKQGPFDFEILPRRLDPQRAARNQPLPQKVRVADEFPPGYDLEPMRPEALVGVAKLKNAAVLRVSKDDEAVSHYSETAT